MKKIKRTKLAIVIGLSIMAFNAFAEENTANNNTPEQKISTEELSKIRMQIKKEQLSQELDSQILNRVRIQSEKTKIEDQLDGGSSLKNGANVPEDMKATEEDRLTEKANAQQNVGFVYKSDEVKDDDTSKKGNSIIDALTGKPTTSEESSDELSKVLKKFDDLKKEADTSVKTANEYVVTKTFLGADITMLYIFDGVKNAKVKFTYLQDDGIQKTKIGNVVSLQEGKIFNVENDSFKVNTIDKDGVVLLNNTTQEEIIITKNR